MNEQAIQKVLVLTSLVFLGATTASAFSVPNTFVNGQTADADQVNQNFEALGQAIDDLGATGLYSNRIVLTSPTVGYSEVCFKAGATKADVHQAAESTAGGNCVPGDTGWIVERAERSAKKWSEAVGTCLQLGFRLPEVFEFKFSCDNQNLLVLGLQDMNDDFEWASNKTVPMTDASAGASEVYSIAAPAMGGANCLGGWDFVSRAASSTTASLPFRCVR